MGWYYGLNQSKSDVIEELIQASKDEQGRVCHESLKHCVTKSPHTRGESVLWVLHRSKLREEDRWIKYIGCYLLESGRDGWGYKPMDETMGPCYYDCPLSFLDEVDEPQNDFSREWREKVREHHATGYVQKPTWYPINKA